MKAVQAHWRLHLKLQATRKKILEHFWTLEVDSMAEKLNKKHSKEQEQLHRKVSAVSVEIRSALLTKWLSYAKSEHINEFMMWRT